MSGGVGRGSPRVVVDDVTIAVDDCGQGAPVVLVLHGFAGSGQAMAPITEPLSAHRRVLAPDLVGHGATTAPREPRAYRSSAQVLQLVGVIDELAAGGPVDVVGYSMGARLALTLADAAPRRVRRLVLISGTAGLDDQTEAEQRRAADAELAGRIEADGVEAFVREWEQLPLFATQARLSHQVRERIRADRLSQCVTGLAGSLRGFGTGAMPALWAHLDGISAPTLVVAGELDAKFVEIGTRLAHGLPNARLRVVPGAGHAVHIEAPDDVVAATLDHIGP